MAENKSKQDGSTPIIASSQEIQGIISSAIRVETPNVKWDDVVGQEEAKMSLKECVVLPLKYPQLFENSGTRMPWHGILLFGSPGAGKKLIARAAVTEVRKCTFITLSAAELMSKGLDRSEKLLKSAFDLARGKKPSVIFIDDLDLLSRDWNGGCSEGSLETFRRAKTEFLVQMTGSRQGSDYVMVIATTSKPWEVDPAIRKRFWKKYKFRFEKRIYIPLPDAPARASMFKLHIDLSSHEMTEENFRELAEQSEGFSGADINLVVREALMQPVRKVQHATHFKRVCGPSREDPSRTIPDLLTPCSPGDPGAMEMKWTDVPGEKLNKPIVTFADMIRSLKMTRPSVGPEDIQRHQEFFNNFC